MYGLELGCSMQGWGAGGISWQPPAYSLLIIIWGLHKPIFTAPSLFVVHIFLANKKFSNTIENIFRQLLHYDWARQLFTKWRQIWWIRIKDLDKF